MPTHVMEAEHSHFRAAEEWTSHRFLAVQFQKDCRHFAFLLVLRLPESILRNNHSWPCFFDLKPVQGVLSLRHAYARPIECKTHWETVDPNGDRGPVGLHNRFTQ